MKKLDLTINRLETWFEEVPSSFKSQVVDAWDIFRSVGLTVRSKQVLSSITFWLIMINLLVALVGNFNVGSLAWDNLAINRPSIASNEWYRLIGSGFAHLGIGHLLWNMLLLLLAGIWMEPFLGKIQFLILYAGSTILGSTFSVLDPNIGPSSAGASKGVYGLMVCFLVLYWFLRMEGKSLLNKLGFLAFLFSCIEFLNLVSDFLSRDGYYGGHLGGAAGGLSFAFWYMLLKIIKPSNLLNKQLELWVSAILLIWFIYLGLCAIRV